MSRSDTKQAEPTVRASHQAPAPPDLKLCLIFTESHREFAEGAQQAACRAGGPQALLMALTLCLS